MTDIEGTTGSIAFVRDVLYPYARRRIAGFVRAHRNELDVAAILDEAAVLAGLPAGDEKIAEVFVQWIDEDRKAAPLKDLQGRIWERGYVEGALRGHVYADAVEALRSWHADGIRLYVYSSGSVEAQHLLFRYSEAGDLTPLFQGYFDTRVGSKREAASYTRIAQTIGLLPGRVLFLSDSAGELDAARAAGLRTVHVVRAGDLHPAPGHVAIRSFAELHVEPALRVTDPAHAGAASSRS